MKRKEEHQSWLQQLSGLVSEEIRTPAASQKHLTTDGTERDEILTQRSKTLLKKLRHEII